MRLSTKHTLAFMLLAVSLPAAALISPPKIEVIANVAGEPRIEIDGIWPNTCTPTLSDASVNGLTITLTASRDIDNCQDAPTPYFLSTEELPNEFNEVSLFESHQIHRIRLEVNSSATHSPTLIGFKLARHPSAALSALPLETGFWWSEQGGEFGAGPGLGISLEAQSNLISLSVMGYDQQGSSAWYFGAGELTEGHARLDLGQFEGGAGPFSRYAPPEDIQLSGWVDVETLTPSRAILWFSQINQETAEIDLRPLSIVRFSFAQDPSESLMGRWLVSGTESGQRDTLWLNFTRTESQNGSFTLMDVDNQAILQCDTVAKQLNSPPSLCRLELADGDFIEFTDVALRRLAGWDANENGVRAFRLD